MGAIWWLGAKVWLPTEAAAVALAANVALTGYIHLDGLADCADGLLPPIEPERRLLVMSDPAVGAYAVVTVVGVVLLRFGALASMHAEPLAIGALWCGSRTAMAVTARGVPYVRSGGLASAFVETNIGRHDADPDDTLEETPSAHRLSSVAVPALTGVAVSVALAVAGRGTHGLAALGAEAVAAVGVVTFARRRIGGFTGDVLGATGVLCETAGLLLLAAKW